MGRRGNGEGSITKRKSDGLYMARYTVETATGQKRKTIYAKTRKEAAERLAKALPERDRGLIFDTDNLTLGEYLERWLETSVKGSVKPITYEGYERMARVHITPALGRIKLKKLTPAHLQGFYHEKLTAGLAPSSVRYIHATLHRALKQAHRWRLVGENVASATDPPKPRPKEIRRTPHKSRRCSQRPVATVWRLCIW